MTNVVESKSQEKMGRLKMPEALAGSGVQRHQGIAEQVQTLAVAPE